MMLEKLEVSEFVARKCLKLSARYLQVINQEPYLIPERLQLGSRGVGARGYVQNVLDERRRYRCTRVGLVLQSRFVTSAS